MNTFAESASGGALIVKNQLLVNSLNAAITRLPFQKLIMEEQQLKTLDTISTKTLIADI